MLTTLLVAVLAVAAPNPGPTCIVPDGTRVALELATTDDERGLGLMFRDSLAATSGMLFIFERDGSYPFWMKNTFIPLDMVWIDRTGKVVDVRDHVQPCHSDPCPSYMPRGAGRAVLEVNAGFAAAHGVAPGTLLRFEDVPGFPVAGSPK